MFNREMALAYRRPSRVVAFWIVVAALIIGVGLTLARMACSATDETPRLNEIIRTLYRQAARWAVASAQDESPIIAVLHANYAAGYLWALKDIVTPEEFARAVDNADFLAIERQIVATQDAATRKLVAACKQAIPVADEELLAAMYYRAPQ